MTEWPPPLRLELRASESLLSIVEEQGPEVWRWWCVDELGLPLFGQEGVAASLADAVVAVVAAWQVLAALAAGEGC